MDAIDIRKLKRIPPTRIKAYEEEGFFPAEAPYVYNELQWLFLNPGNLYLIVTRDWRGAKPMLPRVFFAPQSGDHVEKVKVSDFPPLVHWREIYDLMGSEWENPIMDMSVRELANLPLVQEGFVRYDPLET